jgi:hypothetical protein
MSWLAQYFLNPAFVLPGIALASVPIIIHILSRLRYRKIQFAAMEFLLESEELNRRRLILEQLLLLLLRVLAVILITLVLARLILDPSRMLMLRGASVHHVVILDDTLSLREQTDQGLLFDSALLALEQMLVQSGNQPGTARLTLLLASDPSRPVIADRILDSGTLQDILPRIRNMECSRRGATLSDAVSVAHDILSADGGVSPQLHIMTDFRASDWVSRPELVTALEELQAISARMNIVRLTDESRANVSIAALSADSTSVARGVPWRLDVTVQNFSDQRAEDLRGRVFVDGTPLPVNLLVPPIDANDTITVSHDIAFESEGRHEIEVQLTDDALLEDNRRFIAVEVTDRRPILVIDDDGQQQDARFVSTALAADGELTGLSAEVRTSAALTQQDLRIYDSIMLLNVRDLPADATLRLRQYVINGGGIAWFPDEQANISWYDETLRSSSIGLFPVPLSSIRESGGSADEPEFQTPVFATHPVFDIYNLPDSPFAATVLISRWFGLDDDWSADDTARNDQVTTLARLQNGDPVIFEHSLGRGRILTFLFGSGRRWSNWPVAPAAPGYVVTQLLLQQYLQRVTDDFQSLDLNEPLEMKWLLEEYGSDVEVFLPDSGEAASAEDDTFVRLQATLATASDNDTVPDTADEAAGQRDGPPAPDDQFYSVRIPQADRAGIYRIRRFDTEGNGRETWMALNVAPGESDLSVADVSQISPVTAIEGVRIIDAAAADSLGSSDAGRELRWLIVGLLVAVLVAEQLLSLRMSHHTEGR